MMGDKTEGCIFTVHDAVIAGLRERGWPEPRSQGRNGEFLVPCLVWGQGRYPVVWLAESGLVIGY